MGQQIFALGHQQIAPAVDGEPQRGQLVQVSFNPNPIIIMAYELPKLPYAFDALVPHIDAKTMEIHHGKHHQAYITNANNLLKDHAALAALEVDALIADLSKVPEAIRGGVRNNAGGHSNHSFFWKILGPGKGGAPKGQLGAAISSTFGSFDKFK